MRVHEDITLGKRVRRRELVHMAVHEVLYPAGWSVASHAHAHANLTFVLQGSIDESVSDGARRLRACDAVLKPAGTVHSDRCGPVGARTLVVEFREPALAPADEPGTPGSYAFLEGPEVVRAALGVLDAVRRDSPSTGEDLAEIVVEMLALAPSPTGARRARQEPWLAEVRALLHDGFAAPVRVHELASSVQRHPVYLARAFRRRHGCSVTAYRRRLQVCEAARRLAAGDEALASVAASSGFSDQAHLCRAFRRALGVSPGQFRRRIRAG